VVVPQPAGRRDDRTENRLKGWTIAIALFVVIGALTALLLRESHADLERLELRTAELLDDAAGHIEDATRRYTDLRAVRPNLPALDSELGTLRTALDQARTHLAQLRETRPAGPGERDAYIVDRRAARDTAAKLDETAAALAKRVAILDDFARDGQVRIQELRDAIRGAFETRNELTRRGIAIDPPLLEKLDVLQSRTSELQQLAREVFATTSQGASDAEVLARTVTGEAKVVIDSLRALERDLAAKLPR
jgi:chromosome segregation ATPase